jgi:hypothetical protein
MAEQIWLFNKTSYPARRLGRIRLGGLVFVFSLASGLLLWWGAALRGRPALGMKRRAFMRTHASGVAAA